MSSADINNDRKPEEPTPEEPSDKAEEAPNHGYISKLPPLSTITDRFGNTFQFGNVGGFWCPSFPIGANRNYRSHAREIRDMQMREDDVLIVSYPKTGLHWISEIVYMLMHQTSKYTQDVNKVAGFLDNQPPEVLNQQPSRRALMTHYPFRFVPKQAFEKKSKIVYLERNPKDVMVSYYNHIHYHNPPLDYPGTFEQFFCLLLEVGYTYGDIFEYHMDWQDGTAAYPDANIYYCVYEEMKSDPVSGVLKLNEFLETGCSKALCEDIARACSFEGLKQFKDANAAAWLKGMCKENMSFYRKGRVGDWKNWFTVAMNERFDEAFEAAMKHFKRRFIFE